VKKVNRKVKVTLIMITTLVLLSILLIPGMIFAQEDAEETAETTPETIDIPEKLTYDVIYPKLSAKAGENFEFKFDINYEGDEEATFDIITEGPEDWYVIVSPAYEDNAINAVKLSPGKKESLKVVAMPPISKEQQKPGEYIIKVTTSNEDIEVSEELELSATITAVYELNLSPKYGVLNTKATAGKNNPFIIVLRNNGSDAIEDITFSSDTPQKWIVKFDPEDIDKFEAGDTQDIEVTITPPEKTIAGDYMLNFSVKSEEANDDIDVRVTVETPSIWGWIGIGIIVIVVIGVAVIFARLGRR
jgi:uncharacterized membrane protein